MSIIIALVGPNFGALIADSRACDGEIIKSEDARKLYGINDYVIAGTMGNVDVGNCIINEMKGEWIKRGPEILHSWKIEDYANAATRTVNLITEGYSVADLKAKAALLILLGYNRLNMIEIRTIITVPRYYGPSILSSGEGFREVFLPPPGVSDDECRTIFDAKLLEICRHKDLSPAEQRLHAARQVVQTLASRNHYINSTCQEKVLRTPQSYVQ